MKVFQSEVNIKTKSKPTIKFDNTDKAKLAKWLKLKAEKEELENQIKEIEESLKSSALEKWCQIYESCGDNPGSIILEGKNDDQVLLTVKENLKIKPLVTSVSYLENKYGKIVETVKSVEFEPKLFKKHKKEILRLIKSSTLISKEEKEILIKETDEQFLKKDLNNCLLELQENTKEINGKMIPLHEIVQDLGCTLSFTNQNKK